MGLRDIGATLPPGFRFYPSDEELVCHYLFKKIANEEALKGTLVEIDLHTCEPWQLPEVAKLNTTEWYFFSFRDRKYATGFRTNRATTTGYWKATGKDRVILDPRTQEIVGMRKTLVFYKNRAPNGIKTGWIMHEFRLESPHMPPKEDWVLCRVFHKSKTEENNNNNQCQHMHEHTITASTSSPPTCYVCPQTNSFSSNYTPALSQEPIISHNNIIINRNNIPNIPNINNNNNVIVTNNNIHHLSSLSSPSSLLNPSNNFMHPLKDGNPNPNYSTWSDMVVKNDEYGLLWDMDMDDQSNNMGDLLPPLKFGDDDVRFDNQDDNGTDFF